MHLCHQGTGGDPTFGAGAARPQGQRVGLTNFSVIRSLSPMAM